MLEESSKPPLKLRSRRGWSGSNEMRPSSPPGPLHDFEWGIGLSSGVILVLNDFQFWPGRPGLLFYPIDRSPLLPDLTPRACSEEIERWVNQPVPNHPVAFHQDHLESSVPSFSISVRLQGKKYHPPPLLRVNRPLFARPRPHFYSLASHTNSRHHLRTLNFPELRLADFPKPAGLNRSAGVVSWLSSPPLLQSPTLQ